MDLVVVLSNPQNLVNVASVVRAMKNFGLRDLRPADLLLALVHEEQSGEGDLGTQPQRRFSDVPRMLDSLGGVQISGLQP